MQAAPSLAMASGERAGQLAKAREGAVTGEVHGEVEGGRHGGTIEDIRCQDDVATLRDPLRQVRVGLAEAKTVRQLQNTGQCADVSGRVRRAPMDPAAVRISTSWEIMWRPLQAAWFERASPVPVERS